MNFKFYLTVFSFLFSVTATYSQKPNIVFLLTDDQGYGDLEYNGNPEIITPNIDAFANTAVVFNKFMAAPVCAPTRASLYTGRYNYRTQIVDTFKGRSIMHPDELTLAEILRDNGYKTGLFGKWHLGDNYPMRPQDQGFTDVLMHLGGGIGQPSDPINGSSYQDPVLQHNGVEKKFTGYCMDVYTDHAIQFMEDNKAGPFFLSIATNTPHSPWKDVPQKYLDLYSPKGITGTPGIYYGMITNIDDNFKRLLDKIDELAIKKNTIVIYMSDNGQASAGAARYTASLKGQKAQVYENGIRVPFFIRWPDGFATTKKIETMVAHIDFLPTMLAAANIPLPNNIKFDGRNFMPLITENNPTWTDRNIFFQAHRGNQPNRFQNSATRSQDWKLINNRTYGDAGTITPNFELYDLKNDPAEANNLAGSNQAKVDELRTAYNTWFDDVVATRGFDHHPAHIGTKYENPSTFTGQDYYTPNGQSTGFWRMHVVNAGKYNITLQFLTSEGTDRTVRALGQGVDLTGTLLAGTTEFVFQDVDLQEGPLNLRTWKVNGNQTARRTIMENLAVTALSKKESSPSLLISQSVFQFEISEAAFVTFTIYNMVGEKVFTLINKQLEAGTHNWKIGEPDFKKGIYFSQLKVNGASSENRMFVKK